MKMNYLYGLRILPLILMVILQSCEKDGDSFSDKGPEIEWISGGTTMTYSYSSGSLSAYNLKRSFRVSKESGEVIINVQVEGDDDSKASGTFNVEDGKQYGISIRGGISGRRTSSPGGNCITVVFSSPNCRNKEEVSINSYLVQSFNEWIQDSYYCPNTLKFGEISISN